MAMLKEFVDQRVDETKCICELVRGKCAYIYSSSSMDVTEQSSCRRKCNMTTPCYAPNYPAVVKWYNAESVIEYIRSRIERGGCGAC
jgi:hypothetical protein